MNYGLRSHPDFLRHTILLQAVPNIRIHNPPTGSGKKSLIVLKRANLCFRILWACNAWKTLYLPLFRHHLRIPGQIPPNLNLRIDLLWCQGLIQCLMFFNSKWKVTCASLPCGLKWGIGLTIVHLVSAFLHRYAIRCFLFYRAKQWRRDQGLRFANTFNNGSFRWAK